MLQHNAVSLVHSNCLEREVVKHLPNVGTRFYCPQAFLSLEFHCRIEVSENTIDILGFK